MVEMFHFTAASWYEIEGRGKVACVINPVCWEKGHDPFRGQIVIIDDQPYTVLGVESFALPTIGEGRPIGLLVRGVEKSGASGANSLTHND